MTAIRTHVRCQVGGKLPECREYQLAGKRLTVAFQQPSLRLGAAISPAMPVIAGCVFADPVSECAPVVSRCRIWLYVPAAVAPEMFPVATPAFLGGDSSCLRKVRDLEGANCDELVSVLTREGLGPRFSSIAMRCVFAVNSITRHCLRSRCANGGPAAMGQDETRRGSVS